MVVDSYQGYYATTEIHFHVVGDISVDLKFVSNIHSLCLFIFNSLVRDMVIKVSLDVIVVDMVIWSSSPSLISMIVDMVIKVSLDLMVEVTG
ncbi:hypothetical protein PanWU01x14_057120 [Parasponia andersonii]|uniref:Uncharacterized protein n=1 Tax=Parasponia andersonii TaxID=3476 RepID=A0A2P5DJT6_PARAD|nr:hypothetical protein PanWU01x14_057120 [Parasponia andersonii]